SFLFTGIYSYSRIIMEKSLKIIVAFLVIVALGLGYLILQRTTSGPKNPQPIMASRTPVPSSSVPGTSPTPPTVTSRIPAPSVTGLPTVSHTSDEELILKPPPPAGSKDEDIGRYYATIDRLAKDANTIQLGSQCYANPLVVRIKYGSKLTIVNNDTRDHTINFDGPTGHVIRSKGTETITIDFSHKAGVYAYVCDSKSPLGKIAGALKVMP
ncbi:MAG: hypothetical protein AAB975_01035, partial [Patescibacteria group bacterium]